MAVSSNANGIEVTEDSVDEFLKAIDQLAKSEVLVGIPDSASGRSGPITNAALGYIHENGSPARNIPARPWLYPTVNRLADQAGAMLQKAAEFQLDHKEGQAMNTLEALGLLAVAKIKNNIISGGDPPFRDWSDSYKRQRGVFGQTTRSEQTPHAPKNLNYTILVDTAQLLNAITYVVRKAK